MRFGVIVCPRCKQVKGITLTSKTTKCIRCSKILNVKNLKIFYETNSQEKLRQMIGSLNIELDEKSGSDKKLSFDTHLPK